MRLTERQVKTTLVVLTLLTPLWAFNNCASDVEFTNTELFSVVEGNQTDHLIPDLAAPGSELTSDPSNELLPIPELNNPPPADLNEMPPAAPGTPPPAPVYLPVSVLQPVMVAQKPLDILFVVDNSGSMVEYQKNMGQRINGFLQHIEGLDWQIAVTSTDPNSLSRNASGFRVPWGDGQFRSFSAQAQTPILRPNEVSDMAEAQTLLSQAIEMGSRGSGDERGVRATFRAIERRAADIAQAAFFRQDSALAVVLISDEDECSDGDCSSRSDTEKSQPANLLELIKNNFGENKRFVFNSFIHQANQCAQAHKDAKEGNAYRALSQASGGLVGLVCANDYSQQLSDLGKLVSQLAYEIKLNCEPVDVNGDGLVDLKIYRGEDLVETNFAVEKDILKFTEGLPSGQYRLAYTCLELSQVQ